MPRLAALRLAASGERRAGAHSLVRWNCRRRRRRRRTELRSYIPQRQRQRAREPCPRAAASGQLSQVPARPSIRCPPAPSLRRSVAVPHPRPSAHPSIRPLILSRRPPFCICLRLSLPPFTLPLPLSLLTFAPSVADHCPRPRRRRPSLLRPPHARRRRHRCRRRRASPCSPCPVAPP